MREQFLYRAVLSELNDQRFKECYHKLLMDACAPCQAQLAIDVIVPLLVENLSKDFESKCDRAFEMAKKFDERGDRTMSNFFETQSIIWRLAAAIVRGDESTLVESIQ